MAAMDGEWQPSTTDPSPFPFNFNTYSLTGGSQAHPDLPSEPPNYDEFEFSFPSELSPTLFSLGDGRDSFQGAGFGAGGFNMFSPTGSSLPALSSKGASPVPWPPVNEPGLPSTHPFAGAHDPTGSPTRQHTHLFEASKHHDDREGALVAKKLFEDNERSALDSFFSARLGEASTTGSDGQGAPVPSGSGISPETIIRKRSGSVMVPNVPAIASKLATKEAQNAPQEQDASSTDESVTTQTKKVSPSKKPRLNQSLNGSSGSSAPQSSKSATTATLSSTIRLDSSTMPRSKRPSHMAAEQRRRSTIKDNYKSLVELVLAGEESSGISLAGGDADNDDAHDGKGKKSKAKGRGRGRKGEDGAGATKSAVLERAADYLRWLERGNNELENEIARVESLLAN